MEWDIIDELSIFDIVQWTPIFGNNRLIGACLKVEGLIWK